MVLDSLSAECAPVISHLPFAGRYLQDETATVAVTASYRRRGAPDRAFTPDQRGDRSKFVQIGRLLRDEVALAAPVSRMLCPNPLSRFGWRRNRMKVLLKIAAMLFVAIAAFLVYAVAHDAASAGGARLGVSAGHVAGALLLSFVAVTSWRKSAPTTR
jgi:hypothetical protein